MKDFRTWVIIALLLLIIAGIIFWPSGSGDEGKIAYDDSLKIWQQEKAVIQSMQEATIKGYIARVKMDSSNLALQDRKIQALEQRGVKERVKVEKIIQDNPDLLSFVNTQSEVIQELKVKVDTLKSQLAFKDSLYTNLIANEYVEDKIETQMQIEASKRIADLEKQARKKRRGSKVLKVLAVTGVVGGLLFGSSL